MRPTDLQMLELLTTAEISMVLPGHVRAGFAGYDAGFAAGIEAAATYVDDREQRWFGTLADELRALAPTAATKESHG